MHDAGQHMKPPLFVAGLFCVVWLVLGIYDTGLSGLIPGKSLVRYGLVFAMCFAVILSAIANQGRHYFRGFFRGVFLAMLVGVLSSLLGNSIPLGLIKLALYAVVLFSMVYFGLAGVVLKSEGGVQKLLVLVGVFFVLLALYQGNAGGEIEVGNANYVSALVLIALPLIQLDQIGEKPVLGRQVIRIVLLLAVLAVLLNHSRGAVAGVGVMVGAWIAVRRGPSLTRFMTYLVLGIALLVLIATLFSAVNAYLYKGDERLVDDARQTEFELFQETFSQRPLLGYGFGLSSRVSADDFERAIETWRLSWTVGEFGNSSLAIMSGGGALLFAVFIYMCWKFYGGVWLALRMEFESAGQSLEYQKLAVLFCATLGFLVHSQAEAWLMAPVTLPTVSFWFYVAGAIHISGEIFERAMLRDNETISLVAD